MNCTEAKLKLEPCVSGTLSPEERIQLEEHLAICEGCRLELELTRAVMGAAPFEGVDDPPADAPKAPAPAAPPEPPPAAPPQQEWRPGEGALYDEMSFGDLAPEQPAAGAAPGAPRSPAESAPAASDPDPFENFTAKPDEPAAASWDFEPVEVPRDASPPQGSLSFANEALTRKREAEEKRKVTLVRLALWGGGIGCGLVLLGVSVWIALAFRQERPEVPLPNPHSVTPRPENVTPAPPESTATANPSDAAGAPPPTGTSPAPPAGSSPSPTPGTQSAAAPPEHVPTILDATPGVAPPPGPPPPDTKVVTKPKAKPGTKSGAKSTTRRSAGDEGEFPWTPVDDPPVVRVPTSRPANPPSGTAPVSPAPDAGAPRGGEPVSPPPSQPAPVNPPATAPATPSPQPSAGSPTPAPQAQDPATMKPIDRLHLATETAAKDADIAALRKLKSSWKSLVGSLAGPDRARAKREFADCLWSIQEISGRNSDRREALAAYRDYVLYAPAGGADTRTISRMRFLEDILTDK